MKVNPTDLIMRLVAWDVDVCSSDKGPPAEELSKIIELAQEYLSERSVDY